MGDTLDILVAGGGIAGVETVLALHDLVPEQTRVRLLEPEPEFELTPLAVEEPFTHVPAERRDAMMGELGGDFVDGALAAVDAEAHTASYGFDRRLDYDVLVVCNGARAAFEGAETFWSHRSDVPIDAWIGRAHQSEEGRLALVVPPGVSWPLPLYELALLTRRRSEELGLADLAIEIFTPESAPLAIFGDTASAAVADLLEVRRIETSLSVHVQQPGGHGPLVVSGLRGEDRPECRPRLAGAEGELSLPGLPADAGGFIPTDRLGRVGGVDDVYAAGDGTSFPVKQGVWPPQQADAVAEHIAMRVGAVDTANPFTPVLRGVMNTRREIEQAVADVQAGVFGDIPDA